MSRTVSKETIYRLLKDVKQIIQTPLTDQGIYYVHDDEDMLKGYALIIGPQDTPYFGGNYFFELTFPTDYPHTPPYVKYCTNSENIRFNPNLYACGKVCISLLNTWRGEQWTSCQTITTVLLTLCTLLCNNPLLNEPGVPDNHNDIVSYNKIIEYANLKIAVCDILNKKKSVVLPFFENFDYFVKENFKKNYQQLLDFAINNNETLNGKEMNYKTGFYNMNVNVNYEKIITK